MIRFVLGLLFVFGAVGMDESDPNSSFVSFVIAGCIGLALMYWPITDGSFEEYK